MSKALVCKGSYYWMLGMKTELFTGLRLDLRILIDETALKVEDSGAMRICIFDADSVNFRLFILRELALQRMPFGITFTACTDEGGGE